MKKYKQLLSLLLVFAMILSILPMQAIAESFTEQSGQAQGEEVIKKDAKILEEVTERREKNVKHFIKDDLTFEAAIYPYPVHYKENGKI